MCRRWLRYRASDAWSLDALLGGRRLNEPLDLGLSPEAESEASELAQRVRRAVADLPAGQQAAVVLFYLDGLTQAETAAALGVEVGAVKTRLHKARAALRRSLWDVWKEEFMATETEPAVEFVEMKVEDVFVVPVAEPPGERRIVLLSTADRQRVLPIWVGGFEGDAIAVLLVGTETHRPLTFAFAARLLEAAGGRLQEVRVDRLVDDTFYAEAVVDGPAGPRAFDARPSDAISLALATGAPIRVAAPVLEQAGRSRAEVEEKLPAESSGARERAEEIRKVASPARSAPRLF